MRNLSVLLTAFAIALTTSVYAEPVILEKPLVLNGQTYKVVRTIDNNNLTLKVVDKDSKDFWVAPMALGMQAWDFKLNNKVSSLEVEDLDGDKIPEIITACTTGDVQSAMYIFKYDAEKKGFSAINFGYIGFEGMNRDFMVSDIPAANGENMLFENNAKIRCLGKIYTPNGPMAGYYFFEYKDGKYMAGEAVPAKMENSASPVKELAPGEKPVTTPQNKPMEKPEADDDDIG